MRIMYTDMDHYHIKGNIVKVYSNITITKRLLSNVSRFVNTTRAPILTTEILSYEMRKNRGDHELEPSSPYTFLLHLIALNHKKIENNGL